MLFSAAAILLASSCASQRPATLPPPPKAKTVNVTATRDALTRAGDQVSKARVATGKVDVRLDQAVDATNNAAALAQRAFLDGIKAGSDEAGRLKESVGKIAAAHNATRAELAEVSAAHLAADRQYQLAAQELAAVQADAAAKDQETKTALASLDQANGRIEKANKIADDLAVQKSKTTFWRWSTLAAVIVAILIAVAWRVLP